MPKAPPDRPLSPGQVADLFGVSTTTIATWADEGRLASFRTPGGQRRFRRADVEALLAGGVPREDGEQQPAAS